MNFDSELLKTIDEWIAAHRQELIDDVCAIVSIKSVVGPAEADYPYGSGCARALAHMLARAEGYGFAVENDDHYCGACHLRGADGQKQIGLFAHLDVVPEGEGWAYTAPYTASVQQGYLLGRGTDDNKGPAIAALYALRFLKEKGIPLQSDIMLWCGCCEEAGMTDILHYMQGHRMPDFSMVPDACFPVCFGEKGIIEFEVSAPLNPGCPLRLRAGEASNIVPNRAFAQLPLEMLAGREAALAAHPDVTVQKDGDTARLCAMGVANHAAFPEGSINAIGLLMDLLLDAAALDPADKAVLRTVADSVRDYYGESVDIPYVDDISGKLTCICSTVRIKDGRLHAGYNIRYSIKADQQEMLARLHAHFEQKGFRFDSLRNDPPFYIPLDDPFIEGLRRASDTVLPGLEPYTMGGGTYARKIPRAVGFGPSIRGERFPFGEGHGAGHQPDECIAIQRLLDGLKIYILAILNTDAILYP